MQKNKGFTLVELLAVIVVLGIILIIAIPSIINIVEENRFNTYQENKKILLNIARTYLTSNTNLLPSQIGNTATVQLNDLINNKMIENIRDPKDNSICDVTNSVVRVEKINNNNYKYQSFLQCNHYKTDTTAPDISTQLIANNLTVNAFDDNSLYFDGINDYVEFPLSTTYKNQSFTLMFNLKAFNINKRHCILTTWAGFTTEITSGGLFKFGLSGLSSQYFGSYKLNWDQHYNIAVSYDSSISLQKIYINGQLFEQQTAIGIISYGTSSPLYLSGSWDRSRSNISRLAIWNYTLNDVEILNNMNAINYGNEGLVSFYNFDEGVGNELKDHFNFNNGMIYGATWIPNSGIKRMKIDNDAWFYGNSYTFMNLSSGSHVIMVEDNVGNVATKTVNIP